MLRILITTLLLTILIFPQGKKYEFAKSYLENGNFKDAARLFGELYNEYPNDENVIAGFLQSNYALNQFSKMIPVLKPLVKKENDPQIYALLGDVYWKTSAPEKARQIWNTALDKFSDKFEIYQLIAETQSQNRLFEDAIETYQQARNALKDESIFSEELIKLYISIGSYKNGTKEVINTLNNNRSLAQAKGRLFALMAADGATEFIGSYLQELANKNPSSLLYQDLLAWFFNTTNNFNDAFEVYKRLDDLRNSRGGTLYKFAEDARKDENFSSALSAYEYIIDKRKKYNRYFRNSLLGYARTLEAQFSKQDSISEGKLVQIIDRYEDIIKDDSKSNLAEEAYFRIGTIYKNKLLNDSKAADYFNEVISRFSRSPKAALASIEIGEIKLRNNKIDEAVESFEYVLNNFPKNLNDERNLASYKLGITKYYQGKSQEAAKILAPLLNIENENIANDALTLSYMIGENKDNFAAVDSLGKADFLALRAKTSRDTFVVDNSYRNIHSNFAATPAAEKAFQKLAKFYFEDQPEKSIEVIDDFLFFYPTSILADETLMLKAKAYESLKKTAKAQDIYSMILVEYPNSIFLQEARDSIRRLRGENVN